MIDGDQRTADALRRRLGQVHRHAGRGPAHREAEDDAEQRQDQHVAGQGRADRADDEDQREQQDVVPASVAVGEPSADDGADRRAHGEAAADQALVERGERQSAARGRKVEVGQRARDDAGVIAEQQRAQGRDGHQQPDRTPLARRWCGRHQVGQLLGAGVRGQRHAPGFWTAHASPRDNVEFPGSA
jgi:hypothetical protein